MATVMIEQPFAASVAEALANEAVFVSRNAQLLLRSDKHFIIFREGEYRTSNPEEIEFLLGVVRDEARGNRGVQVRSMPTAVDLGQSAATDASRDPEVPVAVASPPRRMRGPDRKPRQRRTPRERGS
jgi:hypothetical protein